MKQKQLSTLLSLAEINEDQAAKNLSDAREACEFNEARLKELRQFRVEYDQQADDGLNANTFQRDRAFLKQLSEAIDQQETQLVELEAKLRAEEDAFRKERSHKKSIEKLQEIRALEEAVHQRRREQMESDETSRWARTAME